MKLRDAAALLRLRLTGDVAEDTKTVRKLAADMLYNAHPDHGGDGSQIGKIKLARDVLLKHLESLAAVTKCSVCEGEGRVKTPRGPKKACVACGGTGETRRRD